MASAAMCTISGYPIFADSPYSQLLNILREPACSQDLELLRIVAIKKRIWHPHNAIIITRDI